MTETYYQIQIKGLRERWAVNIDRVQTLTQAKIFLAEARSLGLDVRLAQITILED